MHKHLFLLITLWMVLGGHIDAQTVARPDTIYNPTILYSSTPKKYTIAGITVTGTDMKDDYVLIGISGLSVGDEIIIPGEAVTNAVKAYMKQGFFSDASISATKIYGDKIWLNIALTQRPRISELIYHGAKKGEKTDLDMRLGLVKGNQISPNLIDRAKNVIKRYYEDKGFKKIDVEIIQRDDPSRENFVIVDINIDKKQKVKVHKIYLEGNEALSDHKVKRAMKKTNEKGKLINLFRPKKFVDEEFRKDKDLVIEKYNELGYRDATIESDSVWMYDDRKVDIRMKIDEGQKYYIRNISWVGNTLHSSRELEEILDMRKGDVYNQKKLSQRLREDEYSIGNLYWNKGYIFFEIVPVEINIEKDSVDLEMRIREGSPATINKVVINGNDRLYEHVIRRELRTRPGELFSKENLMRSARELAQTGHFNPETLDINPEPHPEEGTVDIVYNLEPKANDQVEFSAGWGQTGVIGRLALKFSNFSIGNLLKPKTYKGIIPQGEGQTFTISAQTNARYYQSYGISFVDPWFGGKRPNAFSLSAYYSRQTSISSNYFNSNYLNSYYQSSLYGYNDGYDYTAAADPSKSLQMFGLTVGWGKRLTWPDDYFTFSTDLSYQLYVLKDWEYIRFFQQGKSHSLSLNFNLSRISIDNPQFTRRGSSFSLSLQLTPPYSLFDGIDYAKLDNTSVEDNKKMYKWIEYHKWKFKGRTYTPLFNADKKYTLVLMTRAEFGFLGSYNKHKKSPFETFYMGGDGMTGYSTYATESIALRGYENGALTPWGQEAYAYTRLGMELHFPFVLEAASTIYGVAFVEGGNAWTSIKKFNPFLLKRSAGAGIRIILPMVGLLGIDYAYGFDKAYGTKGGNNIHFILGQEF